MISKRDSKCIESLIKPAQIVLDEGTRIKNENFNSRTQIWNEISINYEKYIHKTCGEFPKPIDNIFRSKFETSFLILALAFKLNNENFYEAEDRFNEKEIQAFQNLEEYNYFEVHSAEDIKKKLIKRDEKTLFLLENYYRNINCSIEQNFEESKINPYIRIYLKNIWENRRNLINKAVAEVIIEDDFFGTLLSEWKNSMSEIQIKYNSKIDQQSNVINKQDKEISKLLENLKVNERILTERDEKIKEIFDQISLLNSDDKKRESLSRFIETDVAKQFELNFIGRIGNRINELEKVEINGNLYKKIKIQHYSRSDITNLEKLQGKNILENNITKQLPENRILKVVFTKNNLFIRERNILFKAIFLSNINNYISYNFDTNPITLEQVNSIISDILKKKSNNIKKEFILIGSPTGFEKKLLNHISSNNYHKNFTSDYISLCLVDLEIGELFYNLHDSMVKPFKYICELEMDEEKKTRIIKCLDKNIKKDLENVDFITLSSLSEKCGNDELIKACLYEYGKIAGYKIFFNKELKDLIIYK